MTKCEAAIKLIEMVCDLRAYAGTDIPEYREAVAIACSELYKADEDESCLEEGHRAEHGKVIGDVKNAD